MSQILLDTSGYSAFMRGQDELKGAIQRAEEISVTPVVIGELLAGFLRGKNRRKNERELEGFLASPRVRTLNIDAQTSERYAVIVNSLREAGTPIPTNDIWIAASAMQYGLRLLTTDAHYRTVSQVIVDFFEPGL